MLDKDLDVCAFSETWLKGDPRDDVILSELVPEQYAVEHEPRTHSRGGGVALVFKQNLHASKTRRTSASYITFEHLECLLKTCPPVRVVVIYRPPSTSTSTFLDEFESYLEALVLTTGELIIMGDFNVHTDVSRSPLAGAFTDLLCSLGLECHVSVSTHRSGHTLDQVITRTSTRIDPLVTVYDAGISDHHVILCHLPLSPPTSKPTKLVTYRSLKKIDVTQFKNDLSMLCTSDCLQVQSDDLDLHYNAALKVNIDRHAPLKKRVFPERLQAAWYTDDLRKAKQERRLCERRWRKTGLVVHKNAFLEKKKQVNIGLKKAKSNYIVRQLEELEGEPKKQFAMIATLTGKQKSLTPPVNGDPVLLASEFSQYFQEKVENIRNGIEVGDNHGNSCLTNPAQSECSLSSGSSATS